jgi:hypothetical protein
MKLMKRVQPIHISLLGHLYILKIERASFVHTIAPNLSISFFFKCVEWHTTTPECH